MNWKAIAGFVTVLMAASAVFAADEPDPAPPMNAPDLVAWQLFLNATASTGATATFETWASDKDTFKPNATFPVSPTPIDPHAPALFTAQKTLAQKTGHVLPQVPPAGGSEETRRNKPAFDFIVQNKLNSITGLRAAFGKTLSFPIDSIEVKASWIPVSQVPTWTLQRVSVANASKEFHVSTGVDGKPYALVALHVISKAVPNWTWATFESQWNPERCDFIGCRDGFGATQALVPPNAQVHKGYPPCAKTAALTTMIGKVTIDPAFANYCLKGSQVDFTDNSGLAVRVGNSVTESGFVDRSSCMTCHGRAAWNTAGADPTPGGAGFNADFKAPLGPIDWRDFWKSATPLPTTPYETTPWQGAPGLTRVATSADFVWSIPFCAYDDTHPGPPSPTGCQK